MKLRTYLLIFALVILLPMVAFAAIAVLAFDRQQRILVERGGVETARALVSAVDRDLAASVTTLQALATARTLEREDLAGFYEDARRVLAIQRDWLTIVLIAPSGQLALDLRGPFGAPPLPLAERESFDAIMRTGQPVIGPLVLGPGRQRFAFAVRVPVVRAGGIAYVLTGIINPAAMSQILRTQQIPADWVGSIFDSRCTVVARTRGPEQFVGRPLSEEFLRLLDTTREGWAVTHTLEGAPVYTAFSRSDATGWGVGLGIPLAAVEAPLRRSLWTIAGGGVALIVAAPLLSALVGRRIARPIAELSAAAKAFGERDQAPLPSAGGAPAEVDAVARAFREGSALLAARAAERDEALALVDTLVAGAPVGLAFIDRELRYRRVNAAFAAMAGRPVEAHLGQRLGDVLPGVGRQIEAHARRVLDGGRPVTDVELAVASTPDARNWLASFYPVAAGAGVPLGVGCVAVDVTERRRAERDRAGLLASAQAARADAETANRAKDEFLAVLSHELRTPLNAVYGWARMLRTRTLDAATTEHALDVIDRNAAAQVRLIDDLLDVSRIVAGKMRVDRRPVDMGAVIESAVDGLRPAAEAGDVTIEVRLAQGTPPIMGDPERLQQVVWNLVSNAIKFTGKKGRVLVALRAVGSSVEIEVSDTGRGIPAEVLPHVFDRFRQADSTSTRAHGGLGLGLALVRHLVELHGGTVSAASEGEDRGATFLVRLPVPPAEGSPEGDSTRAGRQG